jgi:CRISPR-associated protein Cas2
MLTWVIYDISSDSTRSRVADRCKDYGLQRIQKSVFLGDLASNRVDEVVLFSKELLNEKTDSMYIFPMCRDDFDKVRIIGQGFDEELVADDILTKVI